MAVYLLGDASKDITGQVYTVVGNKIAVWSQPKELRAMYNDGRWTPEQIEERLPATRQASSACRSSTWSRQMQARRGRGEKPNS